MIDIMLDLEYMGRGETAPITQIGAVAFNRTTLETGWKFLANVDLQSSIEAGGVMDASTVVWWMQQSEEARSHLWAPERHPINKALVWFKSWLDRLGDSNELLLWSNGAVEDLPVLWGAYKRSGFADPWNFRNNRCYRTMRGLYPEMEIKRLGTQHNALDDAITQANHLTKIFQKLLTPK